MNPMITLCRRHARGLALALLGLVAACEETRSPDLAGPPRVVRALAVEVAYGADGTGTYLHPALRDGDQTLPESWQGLPDLLTPSTMPVVPVTVVRLVFSELLDGDSVELLDDAMMTSMLKPGVVTLTATPPAGAPAAAATPTLGGFFQPAGSQTGAAPGPALVILPSPAFPSNSTITITLSGSAIRDTGGAAMGADQTITFSTAPLSLAGTEPDVTDPMAPPEPDAVSGGITLFFNAPLDPASVVDAAFELRLGDAMGTPVPFTLTADDLMLGRVIAPVITPMSPVAADAPLTLIVKVDLLRDVHGVPGTATETISFTPTAPAMDGP
jgi:hypothetical protein